MIGRKPSFRPSVVGLEERRLPTAAIAAVVQPLVSLVSLSTTDSKSVAVDYRVAGASLDQPLTFVIERSATQSANDPSAEVVATRTIGPQGVSAIGGGSTLASIGSHTLEVSIPGGLPPDPAHPFVIVVPRSSTGAVEIDPNASAASFRIAIIGVVTHGGFESIFYGFQLPPWVIPMASGLKKAGYDAVIPFNWVSKSSDPGYAPREGNRLAREILNVAAGLPGTGPIDLHLIGHSEGNVVNTIALEDLARFEPARMRAGYIKETLLDPYAASNKVSSATSSQAPTTIGKIAHWVMVYYQHQAKDPLIFVPPIVNDSEVFFQHTPYFLIKDVYDHTLNLWGQTPILGANHYYDLTGIGIGHTDGTTIQVWYLKNIIPLIQHHYPELVPQDPLTASLLPNVAGTRFPAATGTALHGAKIALLGIHGPSGAKPVRIGSAVADAAGHWSIVSNRLAAGSYRVFAIATAPAGITKPSTVLVHMEKLGQTIVDPRRLGRTST